MRRAAWIFLLLMFVSTTARVQVRPTFDARADYVYDLESTATEIADVRVDGEGFVWPELREGGGTAFLALSLSRGRGPAPGLRVATGRAVSRQYFERGARGVRYVDVSAILRAAPAAGERVSLSSLGASWQSGPARLFVFAGRPLRDRRVLVVAPHPDDAEIAAFGVYRSNEADVVTVTAGDAGGANFETLFADPGEQYRRKGWIRTWDSLTVPFYGGVPPGRARNLGYYDATLLRLWQVRPEPVTPPLARLAEPGFYRRANVDAELRDRPFHATWPSLVDDLLAELERVAPEAVVAPHPLLDVHRDHQLTTIALIEALGRWSGHCDLYLYTNHALLDETFPFGPRDGATGLPPWGGGDLYFDAVYSHPLSAEDQRLKLVALEAMHDLRPFDLRDGSRPTRTRRERRESSWTDYFRRGPRPNELFFVVKPESAQHLRQAFLDGLSP